MQKKIPLKNPQDEIKTVFNSEKFEVPMQNNGKLKLKKERKNSFFEDMEMPELYPLSCARKFSIEIIPETEQGFEPTKFLQIEKSQFSNSKEQQIDKCSENDLGEKLQMVFDSPNFLEGFDFFWEESFPMENEENSEVQQNRPEKKGKKQRKGKRLFSGKIVLLINGHESERSYGRATYKVHQEYIELTLSFFPSVMERIKISASELSLLKLNKQISLQSATIWNQFQNQWQEQNTLDLKFQNGTHFD